ncbi:MAG TPA: RDD family protein [Bacillota bacterium]|nr:RDD family protein [Bacillota bacterium]
MQTPENVRIVYNVAGLGTRFFALFIDSIIQNTVVFLFTLALNKFNGFSLINLPKDINIFKGLYFGVLIAVLFLVYFGYFIFFEFFWDGQTPGKKIFGLKVRRNEGRPLDFLSVLIRNIIRLIDMLPFCYIVGFIFAFFNPSWKRLGDFAAGTIVIKERKKAIPVILSNFHGEREAAVRLQLGGAFPTDADVKMINSIREFLRRRQGMTIQSRRLLACELLKKTLLLFPMTPAFIAENDCELWLEAIYRWYEETHYGGY